MTDQLIIIIHNKPFVFKKCHFTYYINNASIDHCFKYLRFKVISRMNYTGTHLFYLLIKWGSMASIPRGVAAGPDGGLLPKNLTKIFENMSNFE